MYRVRLEWPQDNTNRSRPGQAGSVGSCRMTRWKSRYAAGARLIAVPGWPLPAFSTASIARTLMVSTARRSRSDQSSVSVTAVVLPTEYVAVASDPTYRPHPWRVISPRAGRVGVPPGWPQVVAGGRVRCRRYDPTRTRV